MPVARCVQVVRVSFVTHELVPAGVLSGNPTALVGDRVRACASTLPTPPPPAPVIQSLLVPGRHGMPRWDCRWRAVPQGVAVREVKTPHFVLSELNRTDETIQCAPTHTVARPTSVPCCAA